MQGHSRGGRRSKGERRLLAVRPPVPVWAAIHVLADVAGTSASQLVADLLAVHVGRADLVSGEGRTIQEGLPLAM